ncbi:MAG: hypothetical protein AAGA20_14420 [Planctomycetota bacterium]
MSALALALALAPQLGLADERTTRATILGPGDFPQPFVAGEWLKLEIASAVGRETFGLYVPSQQPTSPAPLLVHFHARQGAHFEVGLYTEFMAEAESRGWYLVCPDQDVQGVNGTTYGSPAAQRRVEAVLDWAVATLSVDEDRIYAYGFSMGGGDVLSYAAQHLDPSSVVFAAVAQNAGTLSLTAEYRDSPVAASELVRSFGVTPGEDRFAYVRASSLDYDPLFDLLHRNAAVNLASTPAQSWFSTNERALIRGFGDDMDLLLEDHDSITGPSNSHRWDTFDFTALCDWFAAQSLVIPQSGRILAAHDGRYHDVWIHRPNPGEFGRVTFDVSSPNLLRFTEMENVDRLRVDALVTGVPATFAAVIEPDAIGFRTLRIDGYGDPPSQVMRAGQVVPPGTAWRMKGETLILVTPPSASGVETRWFVQD